MYFNFNFKPLIVIAVVTSVLFLLLLTYSLVNALKDEKIESNTVIQPEIKVLYDGDHKDTIYIYRK